MTLLQQYSTSTYYLQYIEQYAGYIATGCRLPKSVTKIIAEYCLQAAASDHKLMSATFTQWLTSEQMLGKFLLCVKPKFLTNVPNFSDFMLTENSASRLWSQYCDTWKAQKAIVESRKMLAAQAFWTVEVPTLEFCRLKEADMSLDQLWIQFVATHCKDIYLYFMRMLTECINEKKDYFLGAGEYRSFQRSCLDTLNKLFLFVC